MVRMEVTLIGVDVNCNNFMYEFSPFAITQLTNDVDRWTMEYRQIWRI